MLNHRRNQPSTEEQERAERLREVLEELKDVNEHVPVIVEGKRDASALRSLGLEGEIITLNRGRPLYDFCEEMVEEHPRLAVILDWDETGEELTRTLSEHLVGHFEEYSSYRELLKILCQKDIKDVEGIPGLLARLEGPFPPIRPEG